MRDGAARVPLDATLLAAVSEHESHATSPARVPFKFSSDGRAAADTRDGALTVTLALSTAPDSPAAVLAIEAAWHKAVFAHRVAVELKFPAASVTAMGRDLKPIEIKNGFLERFDPKWIVLEGAAPITLIVDDTVDDVELHAEHGEVIVRIDLDSADARPFLHDARCAKLWKAPNRHLPTPVRPRAAGDRAAARVQLALGRPTPLVQSRFPDGRRAALVVTDHADQSSARTLTALAHGLLAHHLQITKALFAHGSDRPQLEDPEVVKLADALFAGGSEIIPHSATPKPDDRATTSAALERFETWHARTWIDHQPETNCEAFGDQGWTSGRFGIADLLVAHHYQYVWAEDDQQPGDLNLLGPARLDHRAPTVWPLGRLTRGGPDSLWMFRSEWAFIEAKRFYKMYGADRLDKLERERGLHIAHTYLETMHPKRTRFGLRNLLKLEGDAAQLDPRFEKLLGELETRQARGTLWVPTVAALGDRLRATAEVTLTLGADGAIVVHAAHPVPGATFVVPLANATIDFGGHAPRGLAPGDHETTFWDDLPEGDTAIKISAPASK